MSEALARYISLAGLVLVFAVLAATFRAWAPALRHAIPSVWRIAKITVAEARRRVVQGVIALVALLLISEFFFAYMSPKEQARMLISSGLAAITIFGIVLAIFIAGFMIPSEIEARTVYAILAKPVRRFEFIMGKYLGAVMMLGAIMATMTAVLVAVLLVQSLLVSSTAESQFDPNLPGVLFAAFMSFCAVAVLTSVIVLISTVSSTAMTVVSALIVWAVGSMQTTIHDLSEHAEGAVRAVLLALYYVVPRLENFDFRNDASNFMPISLSAGWLALGGGVLYAAVVLFLAGIFFNDRQV